VAVFMNSHERPQDPRFKGSVARKRKYHDTDDNCTGRQSTGMCSGALT
jgi:thiosulfate dehydrogenase